MFRACVPAFFVKVDALAGLAADFAIVHSILGGLSRLCATHLKLSRMSDQVWMTGQVSDCILDLSRCIDTDGGVLNEQSISQPVFFV